MMSAFALYLLLCGFITRGINGQFTVTIISTPAGTPVSGSINTFDYPILSNVTLTCNVTSDDGSTPTVTGYSWDAMGCYVNNRNERRCFPAGQTTQNVNEDDILARDAGTITCTATIGGMDYTSGEFTLRVSGISITTTGSGLNPGTDLVTNRQLNDYSYLTEDLFTLDQHGVLLRCASGLGPSSDQATLDLGGWFFNEAQVSSGDTCGSVFQNRGANGRVYPGVINLYPCGSLSHDEEGVYSCMIMNSSMMVQTTRVGLYLSGRSVPLVDSPTPSTETLVVGDSVTLSCTSRGSPPDTFTWMKDGTLITSSSGITQVTHNTDMAVFSIDYTINSVAMNDSGNYTCIVTNPIGTHNQTITVIVNEPTTPPMVTVTNGATGGVLDDPQLVDAGSSFTLSCVVTGTPTPTISWTRGSMMLTSDGTISIVESDGVSNLTIMNFMVTDGGVYTCNATSSAGTVASSSNLRLNVTVTIVSNPAGTPGSESTNTFDYPILSSVTLTCMVTLANGETFTGAAMYQWDTTGCYTNTARSNNPTCFPTGQTAQNVTDNNLLADDAGTITCTATLNGVDYTSDPLTLRISGVGLVGGMQTTRSNIVGSDNIVDDYSAINVTDTSPGILFRCVTGLGPSGNSNEELGQVSFNGTQISHGTCGGRVVQSLGADITNLVGVINVQTCTTFTVNEEGVYTCTIRNSSMVNQTVRVGVYLPVRTAPVITTTSSTVDSVLGSPLTLSCTSQGSPPDTFTWMKDGTPAPLIPTLTTVTHDSTTAEFRSDYIINSVTTSDSGTYTCTVTNPIGSGSGTITVVVNVPPMVNVTNGVTGGILDDPQLVDAGSSFTLSCVVTGTPTPTVSWTRGSMVLSSDSAGISIMESDGVSNLTIMNFMATDGGVYTCNATNSAGTATVSSDVRLNAAVITSSVTNIQLLEPLTLTCSVDPSVTTSGVVSYQWTIGCSGGGCSWSGMTITNLTNPYIRGRDYGDYICIITEDSTVIGRRVFTINRIEDLVLLSKIE